MKEKVWVKRSGKHYTVVFARTKKEKNRGVVIVDSKCAKKYLGLKRHIRKGTRQLMSWEPPLQNPPPRRGNEG